jgi:hypothetical protein
MPTTENRISKNAMTIRQTRRLIKGESGEPASEDVDCGPADSVDMLRERVSGNCIGASPVSG